MQSHFLITKPLSEEFYNLLKKFPNPSMLKDDDKFFIPLQNENIEQIIETLEKLHNETSIRDFEIHKHNLNKTLYFKIEDPIKYFQFWHKYLATEKISQSLGRNQQFFQSKFSLPKKHTLEDSENYNIETAWFKKPKIARDSSAVVDLGQQQHSRLLSQPIYSYLNLIKNKKFNESVALLQNDHTLQQVIGELNVIDSKRLLLHVIKGATTGFDYYVQEILKYIKDPITVIIDILSTYGNSIRHKDKSVKEMLQMQLKKLTTEKNQQLLSSSIGNSVSLMLPEMQSVLPLEQNTDDILENLIKNNQDEASEKSFSPILFPVEQSTELSQFGLFSNDLHDIRKDFELSPEEIDSDELIDFSQLKNHK